jgi:hypothetical protein
MTDDLIVIHDDQIDVQDIMRQIRANIARRTAMAQELDPVAMSDELWSDTMGEAETRSLLEQIPLTRHDCDIVPQNYVIDWRNPVLGPHAVIRRVINDEVRRYLDASLAKQTRFNETVLRTRAGWRRKVPAARDRSAASATDGESTDAA